MADVVLDSPVTDDLLRSLADQSSLRFDCPGLPEPSAPVFQKIEIPSRVYTTYCYSIGRVNIRDKNINEHPKRNAPSRVVNIPDPLWFTQTDTHDIQDTMLC